MERVSLRSKVSHLRSQKGFLGCLFFFLFVITAKASPVDTIDNWQLRVNGKAVVFGNYAQYSGDTARITISETDKLEIIYNYCSPRKIRKEVMMKANGKYVLTFNNGKTKQDAVPLDSKKIIAYLSARKIKSEVFRFSYLAGNPDPGIPTQTTSLFTIEISIK